MGDPVAHLFDALERLSKCAGMTYNGCSSFYETTPVGDVAQANFINAVCRIQTELAPSMLLAVLKDVEYAMGRMPGVRWGPRPIDLDILLYGHMVMLSEWLLIPHPELVRRQFVLVPLLEIEPDICHPYIKQPVASIAQALETGETVRKVPDDLMMPQMHFLKNMTVHKQEKKT